MMVASLSLTLVFLASPSPGVHMWSEEDIVTQEWAPELTFSPDGSAIWVRTSVDLKENREYSHLWITRDLSPGQQLTRGNVNDKAPQVSPDGKLLVFLSSRPLPADEKKMQGDQLWALPLTGGEPYPLTRSPKGVKAFAFATAEVIIFLAEETPDAWERRQEKAKDKAQAVEDPERQPRTRLFELHLPSGKVRRLTQNREPIVEFATSPDGQWVVFQVNVSPSFPADARKKPETYLLHRTSNRLTRILADRPATPTSFRFTRDSRFLAFSETYSSDPQWEGAGVEKLYRYNLEANSCQEVPLDWARGLHSPSSWVPVSEGFLVLLADGTRNVLALIAETDQGFVRTRLGEESFSDLRASPNGDHLALLYSDPATPPQWLRAKLVQGELQVLGPITDINKQFEKKPKARAETIRWLGAKDEEVEGILYYPLAYRPGERYPLIVMIHGGPAAAEQWVWKASWAYAPQLFTQRGAFVLLPNYHGSSHYGLSWVESIKGRYYELEVPDILRGVDALIAKGSVDPEQLGVLGWSNGAILTVALTVATNRFKAAVAGAGDVNWISDYGNCAFGVRFDNSYFGGPPWERLEHYIAKSPLFRLSQVTTPTLILFGTEDTSVPTEQGWQHFRALQQIGKAPVRFVLFPEEGHSLAKPAHRLRKLREELGWFDRYLFSRPAKHTWLYSPDAPLAVLVARQSRAQVNGAVGVKVRGKLIPETVLVPELGVSVAPFEVTEAQWAAFDATWKPRPGRENFPRVGVDSQKAQEYCRFLSRLTGRHYRLPTLGEWEQLQKQAHGPAVTWERWLGEPPAFDDLAPLHALLASLGGVNALLLPVGSGDVAGNSEKSPIFDLAGNAAEWVMQDGSAVLKGGCAVCFEDEQPPLALAGFRVVEEAPQASP
ncbi:MAG: S9 family peptidase [Thermoanaerobaculaceae bacterium]